MSARGNRAGRQDWSRSSHPAAARRRGEVGGLLREDGDGLETKRGRRTVRLGTGLVSGIRGEIAIEPAKRVAALKIAGSPADLDASSTSTVTVIEVAAQVNELASRLLVAYNKINELLAAQKAAGFIED